MEMIFDVSHWWGSGRPHQFHLRELSLITPSGTPIPLESDPVQFTADGREYELGDLVKLSLLQLGIEEDQIRTSKGTFGPARLTLFDEGVLYHIQVVAGTPQWKTDKGIIGLEDLIHEILKKSCSIKPTKPDQYVIIRANKDGVAVMGNQFYQDLQSCQTQVEYLLRIRPDDERFSIAKVVMEPTIKIEWGVK